MRIDLDHDEMAVILRALQIAAEDGSIYLTVHPSWQAASDKRINACIEGIEAKLTRRGAVPVRNS